MLLNTFPKIDERYIHNSKTPFVNNVLCILISAYRKSCSSNHVLLRLIENWKESLDSQKFVRTVLMELSQAFDCISHNLLMAKIYIYGFGNELLKIFFSYLKGRKENVKINNTYSAFQVLLYGVPQESVLSPILFNIFINDLLLRIENIELHNFACDNIVSYTKKSLEELIKSLTSKSEKNFVECRRVS